MRRWAALGVMLSLPACVSSPGAESDPTLTAALPPLSPAPPASTLIPISLSGTLAQGALLHGTAPPGTVALSLDAQPMAVAPDRRFILGLDRDAPPLMTLSARLADGRVIERRLIVAPSAWPIERVDAPLRGGSSSAEFAARRPAELQRIAAARMLETGATGWRQRFIPPATGRVSGRFGAQRIYRGQPGSYHSGTDYALPTGTPFVAPADGVVVLAAATPFTLEGRLLIIDHGMGLSSAFLHASELAVTEGESVRQGQIIGRVGATGRASGPHLHWGMTWRGARIDPEALVGG